MRWSCLVLLVLSVAAVGGEADKDKLQGTWRLDSVEINKQPLALENLKKDNVVLVAKLVVQKESYTFHLGEDRLTMTYLLHSNKRPAEIDLTVTDVQQKGKTYHGIYKIEGDTYTVCRNVEPGKERPAAFATQPNSGLMLVVWKREKAASGAR